MDFDHSPPGAIAAAIAPEISHDVHYQPVETDGAARAAAQLVEMLLAAPPGASRRHPSGEIGGPRPWD